MVVSGSTEPIPSSGSSNLKSNSGSSALVFPSKKTILMSKIITDRILKACIILSIEQADDIKYYLIFWIKPIHSILITICGNYRQSLSFRSKGP